MELVRGDVWKKSESSLVAKINQEKRLMYYFSALNGMNTTIIIQKDWESYIVKNQEIIKGWLEYNMIIYLQRKNPSVPGIADKLYPPQERKLEKVKRYWKYSEHNQVSISSLNKSSALPVNLLPPPFYNSAKASKVSIFGISSGIAALERLIKGQSKPPAKPVVMILSVYWSQFCKSNLKWL